MNLSLNEIEALAKKATRGAGYSWGMAEEAGKATRWLCGNGLDGCAALSRVLVHFDGQSSAIAADGHEWRGADGELCPISTGATLSDFAHLLGDGEITLHGVVEPVFLLPFAASCAAQLDQPVALACGSGNAATDGKSAGVDGKLADGTVTVSLTTAVTNPRQRETRAAPSAEDFETLNRFAHRTYAPATEASRLKGAGAGTSDND